MSSIHADPPPPIVTEPTGINYATGSALGKGGFAICHRAERYDGSRPTGHMVALKIVKTKMEPAKLAQKFVSELQIHSKLSHPNIVVFYRAFSFQTSTYVVLELCPNGSLADMLKKRKHMTLPEIRRFVIQICGAVKYLHHRHIVHRDLKTGNLFLDADMNVKVGDFGLAALLVTEKEMEVKRRTTMCGTPNYLAPEILEKGKGHDEKVDLWAIGVIAYTLAVGKAPFHASTKEEIYKKLKSGTYTWPELSATTNQSADLRDLVANILVPEEQRPLPDQIVSQAFFKIAFVPSSIPSSAREKAPTWPQVSLPSAETVRRGYSDTWYALCKQSGVGEVEEGKAFRLNGGKRVKSIVYDMAQEAQLGRAPTMPIPKDIVYVSTVSKWDSPITSEEERSQVERRPQSRSRGLKEMSHNEVAATRPEIAARRAKDTELMPPPPTRPPSRPGRVGTLRRVARTISEETADSNGGVRIASDEPAPALRVSKTRLAPTTATTTLKDSNSSSSSAARSARSQQSVDSDIEKPKRTATLRRGADASLARRPRAASKAVPTRERPVSPEVPGPLATLDELAQISPIKRSRRKAAEAEVIEILSDPEPIAAAHYRPAAPATSAHLPPPPRTQTTSRRRLPSDPVESAPTIPAPSALNLNFPPPPSMSHKRLPFPRNPTGGDDGFLPGTDPATVLSRLTAFHANLAAALRNSSSSSPSSQSHGEADSLPFVSRWVDYSRKHGVGYVMSDGTVGCIINASAKTKTPVTHLVVRNGQHHLSRIGKNFENIDTVPLEILEDRGEDGIARKVYKGLGSVGSGPLVASEERRRTLGVLWVKFGRYMCQSLDGQEESLAGKGDGNFMRFYQRIGNVGIWGFGDGSLQVHFPDHTKLVLSPGGTHISATCISPEAAAYLASHSDLLPHHVSSREVLADSVVSLLHESGRVRMRIVKANALAEKLEFIEKVVGQWIAEGGIGRLCDDYGDGGHGEKLYWEGLCVKDGAKKVDRVTVGRSGGD